MERWIGKIAIVTGASAGIGQAITQQLAEIGVNVVAVARRLEKLEELKTKLIDKKGKIYPFKADITKEQDVLNLFAWVKENLSSIHILINSAGVIRKTNLTEGKSELWKEVFDTNVLGLCITTREAVQDMRANKVDGHIIHINSLSGHKVVFFPNSNVYPASKYAVTALTETLRNELNSFGDKIKISSISPGYVSTDIMEAGYKASGCEFTNDKKSSFDATPSLNAEDVANAVMYVLSTPPHVQVHEIILKAVGEKF